MSEVRNLPPSDGSNFHSIGRFSPEDAVELAVESEIFAEVVPISPRESQSKISKHAIRDVTRQLAVSGTAKKGMEVQEKKRSGKSIKDKKLSHRKEKASEEKLTSKGSEIQELGKTRDKKVGAEQAEPLAARVKPESGGFMAVARKVCRVVAEFFRDAFTRFTNLFSSSKAEKQPTISRGEGAAKKPPTREKTGAPDASIRVKEEKRAPKNEEVLSHVDLEDSVIEEEEIRTQARLEEEAPKNEEVLSHVDLEDSVIEEEEIRTQVRLEEEAPKNEEVLSHVDLEDSVIEEEETIEVRLEKDVSKEKETLSQESLEDMEVSSHVSLEEDVSKEKEVLSHVDLEDSVIEEEETTEVRLEKDVSKEKETLSQESLEDMEVSSHVSLEEDVSKEKEVVGHADLEEAYDAGEDSALSKMSLEEEISETEEESALSEMSLEEEVIHENTPLHIALSEGDLETVKRLVEQGANLRAKNPEGKTPLDIAASRRHLEPIFEFIFAELDDSDSSQEIRGQFMDALREKLNDAKTPFSTFEPIAKMVLENSELFVQDFPDFAKTFENAIDAKLSDSNAQVSELKLLARHLYKNRPTDSPWPWKDTSNPIFLKFAVFLDEFPVFQKVNELAKQPSPFKAPSMQIGGAKVAINMAELRAMSRGAEITREQLPENATREAFEKIVSRVEAKGDSLPKLGTKLDEVRKPFNTFRKLLDQSGNPEEIVSDTEAKWRKVLSIILDLDNEIVDPNGFTDQENAFILTTMGIQNCTTGQEQGIANSYNLLDVEQRYKVSGGEKFDVAFEEEWKEEKDIGRNELMQFLASHSAQDSRAFAEYVNDEAHSRERQGWANRLLYDENKAEYWDEDTYDLTEEGAGALLRMGEGLAQKRAEEAKVKEAKGKETQAREFIGQVVNQVIEAQFTGVNKLMQNLTGQEQVNQGAHQATYLRNLIGGLVGLSPNLIFDQYERDVHENLLNKSRDEVLSEFFKFVTPESFMKELQRVASKEVLAPLLREGFWDDNTNQLTPQGALGLLEELNYIKTAET